MSFLGELGEMSQLAWVSMLLIWGGVIVLAIWAVRHFVPRDHRSDQEVAREVLQRRYAAGEISDAEYQQALKTLR